mgnify:CR=1 FL=1
MRSPVPLGPQHALDAFACGQPALDDWLRRHARQAHASGSARVYVAADGEGRVLGYYALAVSQLGPDEAPQRLLKGQPARRPVPAVLLARLAVDRTVQGLGVGKSLLRDAVARVLGAAESIGIRCILVHAKSEEARRWYEGFGFEPTSTDPFHLALLLKDARHTL